MGNLCATRNFDRSPEYFYKNININELDNSAKEKVKLNISIMRVSSTRSFSVSLLLYNDKTKRNYKLGGETENQTGSPQVTFNQFFIMEYYFEKEQNIGFLVKSSSGDETIQCTLGAVMGSRGQKYQRNLRGGEILEISGKSLDSNNLKASFNVTTTGILNGMSICYLLKYLGTQSSPVNSPIYRSEVKEGGNTLTFDQVGVPIEFLSSGGNYNDSIVQIELEDKAHSRRIGQKTTMLSEFIGKDLKFNLENGNQCSIKCNITRDYAFLDYLRGGMQIALTIAIDFTGSNRDPSDPKSLHNISSNKMNNYEEAIRACGNIVGYYDYDQLFPVYGYGAIVPGENQVNHCFPINRSDDPNINTIDGVLAEYRKVLPTLRLYGPTFFAPIINALNEQVKQDLQQGNQMQYNILMILTDGQINDMDNTIDALVEASFLPISVIIVGIGYADFGNMDILDADENPLFDRNHRKADRDLVQFVPFYKYKNDGEELAAQVLEEVPRQVVEYYQHNKIIPGDPIMNIQ